MALSAICILNRSLTRPLVDMFRHIKIALGISVEGLPRNNSWRIVFNYDRCFHLFKVVFYTVT